jgi:hypothetical protein
LILGSYRERLQADLVEWSVQDYVDHWRKAVERLIQGASFSRLVTSYRGRGAGFHFTWPLWREESRIFIQEQLILKERLSGDFRPSAAWDVLASRQPELAGATWASEWELPIQDLRTWLAAPSSAASA